MKRELLPRPITYASGYALDLYCKYLNPSHVFGEFPHQYTGQHGPSVFAKARKAGWVIHEDCTATCPKCRHPATCREGGRHEWSEGYPRGKCKTCGLTRRQAEK